MSAINCHFDGDCCAKKQARFNAWQKVISQTNGLVQISPDALSDCPISDETERNAVCDRYRMYLFIIKKHTTTINRGK